MEIMKENDFALPLKNVSQDEISNTSHHESNFEMDANCTEFLHKEENISHPDLITERKIEKVEQEKDRNIDKDLDYTLYMPQSIRY